MRWILKFDGTFFEYLKRGKRFLKPALIILLGIILIVMASGIGNGGTEYTEDELTAEVRDFCESIEGVGKCRVLISYKKTSQSFYSQSSEKEVYAVAVACRGAKSAAVRKELSDLLSSMFGIGSNRVSVLLLDS